MQACDTHCTYVASLLATLRRAHIRPEIVPGSANGLRLLDLNITCNI